MCAYFAGHKDLNLLNPESQKIFRKLVENIKIGVFMADNRDRLFYVNPSFIDIFELRASSDLLGQDWNPILFRDPDVREQFFNKLNKTGHIEDFETTHITSRGQEIAISITANYIRSDQSENIGIQGVISNISDRRKLEKELEIKHQKLELLSFTDPMTELLNFRGFTQKIDEEINRVIRYGSDLSLMMIDVDNFKTYNDTHGHLQGDQLLKRLGGIFKKSLRSTEYICRYGGDEFSIIMPNTNCMNAAIAAEKLRGLIAQEFQTDHISLSIGVAQFQDKSSKDIFIKQADNALYEAKKSGRNRVFLNRGLSKTS